MKDACSAVVVFYYGYFFSHRVDQLFAINEELSEFRYRKKSFLARANEDGSWSRVANGDDLPNNCLATGHCVRIVWSARI